ncbi:hypothetical protein DQ04_03981000, partial [Trypanosoma grayi]|uniref:hypothetical protein n=1 Tax=Trypanosoma grayi TaxID=71804 RepID=UPI0004F4037B
MLSGLLASITAASPSTQDLADLETSLEQHMTELIALYRHLKASLLKIVGIERQTAGVRTADAASASAAAGGIAPCASTTGGTTSVHGFAMGMTYLAVAIVMSGRAAEEDNAALLLDVVERHLLSPGSSVYDQLRGHKHALRRFGQLLEGYVALLDVRDAGNYRRKLHYLHRAAVCFAPSPDYLTVAHALLVREASRSFCPAPALAIMRQPVLEVSPADTGADLLSFHSYYCEGGLLLARMRCWDDATVWLRSALSLVRRAAPRAGGEGAAAAAPVLGGHGGGHVLVTATKALILVSIIRHGDFSDPVDRKRVQQIIQQFRGSDTDVYLRLLAAAAKRDGKSWDTLEKHFASLWQQDEMTALVAEAGARLGRHIIRDTARVASRVYLSTIVSDFRAHSIAIVEGDVSAEAETFAVVQLLLAMQEEGEMLVSLERVTPKRAAAAAVQEEQEEEAEATGSVEQTRLAVRFAMPPTRIPATLGSC